MSPIVLITGCSIGGIGSALCEEFAARGCKVYATARSLDKMDGLSLTIERMRLDVTSDDDVNKVIQEIVAKEGRIDIVVNNAGRIAIGPLIDISLDEVKDAFDTNTFSVLRVSRAVIPHMAARKRGLIVNIGSIAGDTPTPWNGLYSATKSSVHIISETLSMECKPFNIRVMNVAPGSVRSNISKNHEGRFRLPENSLYTAFLPNIIMRLNASQTQRTMSAESFAKLVVSRALSRDPPLHLTGGGNSFIFQIFKWLPRTWVLWYLWRLYSKRL
ncbi:NADPH-dependent 1-acyl dihydroxyacetone phosphate reductase [Stygiomarasmius scandens]|uniref:NADPH-dependent 1-acyl dihydroxyacetone phosphate reductase n=1 Tax=Marasmiellus scandens TaxID=2682957 RepID=A0ABR1JQF2_9AGAR